MSEIGVVAIGRNEGERLLRCLGSLSRPGPALPIVYVDSGSTDGSVAAARARGVEVVELDMSMPFSAARARNAGVDRLLEIAPHVRFVQFVDGDCEVAAGWLDRAHAELQASPELAVVCGRRRERFPEQTAYNRIMDLEWDSPIGETLACGGDAMMRVTAFREVGGFNPALIAGEEPELCVRLRQRGWKVLRVDAEMTLHDAAMTRFGQWWKRGLRTGHAFAEGNWRHGEPPERHYAREVRSQWFWGIVLPVLVLALAWPTQGASLILLAGYPALGVRVYRRFRARGLSAPDARLYALSCVAGRFPAGLGGLRFYLGQLFHRPAALIEYKMVSGE